MPQHFIEYLGATAFSYKSSFVASNLQVFLKYYHIEELDRLLEHYRRLANLVQAVAKGWLARVHYKKRRRNAILIQKSKSLM